MQERSPGAGRRVVAAGALAAMVAGLVYVARAPAPDRVGAPETDLAAAPAPAEVAAVAPAPPAGSAAPPAAAEPAPEPEPEAAPAPAVAAPAPPPPPEAPRFDVVRVSPDGSALVAGRAAPGAVVTIMADAAPLAEVEADAEGNFVAIFRAEPSAVPQALTLEAAGADGSSAASEDVVMLLPEAPEDAAATAAEPAAEAAEAAAEEAVASADPAAAEDTAPPAEATPDAEPVASEGAAPAEPAAAEPRIAATAILRQDAVEAAPTGPAGRGVTLASISYAEEGEVTLAGLGTAGAVLRVYVDGALAREAEVGDDGRWSMELGEVAAGVYRLRIDQLGGDGRVASRVETPFQRDYPRAPEHRPGAEPAEPAATVTVQPGHNLWTLARLRYGSGVLYTQIFTANRALIRDPDLIYPGQIFAMPEIAAEQPPAD